MRDRTRWKGVSRPLVAAAAGGLVAWIALVANREVPMLDLFDLGVHEAGHLIAAPLPTLAVFLAGSIAQVAFPLGMAWYFGVRRQDPAAAGFCLAWAGASAWDVSVYAGDAVTQSLPLVGGGEHDWAYILGPNGFDALHMTDQVAGFIEFCGWALAVVGVGLALRSAAAGLADPPPAAGLPAPGASALSEVDPWLAASSLPFRYGAD